MSQACRTYIRANLDMNLFSLIYNYKSNLSYAPMLSGRKGVKRADMTVDSTSYFKEILQLDILHTPEQKYYNYYTDFVKTATGIRSISLCKTLFGRTCFLPGVLPVI